MTVEITLGAQAGPKDTMKRGGIPGGVVHLELHTCDLAAARAFYAGLLGARFEHVELGFAAYLVMDMGNGVGGGIVECGLRPSAWLPYVAVTDIGTATERACELGATVLLEPREGPAGWRAVVAEPAGGQLALWEGK